MFEVLEPLHEMVERVCWFPMKEYWLNICRARKPFEKHLSSRALAMTCGSLETTCEDIVSMAIKQRFNKHGTSTTRSAACSRIRATLTRNRSSNALASNLSCSTSLSYSMYRPNSWPYGISRSQSQGLIRAKNRSSGSSTLCQHFTSSRRSNARESSACAVEMEKSTRTV